MLKPVCVGASGSTSTLSHSTCGRGTISGAFASGLLVVTSRRRKLLRRWTPRRGVGGVDPLNFLDEDGDGKISKEELATGLRKSELDNGENAGEIADEMFEVVDLDGDGFITAEEWQASLQRKFDEKVALASAGTDGINANQMKDILQYVFTQWDADGDGQIDFEEFQQACAMMGMKLSPAVARRTFLILSNGEEYIINQTDKTDTGILMESLQSSLNRQVQSYGLSKAAYLWQAVSAAWTRSDRPVPDRLRDSWEAFCTQSDVLPDLTESLSDLVGLFFAVLAINKQVNCGDGCSEDGFDWTSLIPLVVLLRRVFTDSFRKIQEALVQDLDQDKALVFTTAFKPAGLAVADFEQIWAQGHGEWRMLNKGMNVDVTALGDSLQVIARGSMAIRAESIVPGLEETSVVLGQGTFLGVADFMDDTEDGLEQKGHCISVLEDTLVLVWDGPSLRRFFQVNTSTKQRFQVMLARSIERTMWQLSQYSQRMAIELPILFRDFVADMKLTFRADRACLWVYNDQKDTLWTLFETDEGSSSFVSMNASTGLPGLCYRRASAINVPHCQQDSRFDPDFDEKTGYRTESTLCLPIFKDASNRGATPIGVAQLLNRHAEGHEHDAGEASPSEGFSYFTSADEQIAERTLWLTSLMIEQLVRRYTTD